MVGMLVHQLLTLTTDHIGIVLKVVTVEVSLVTVVVEAVKAKTGIGIRVMADLIHIQWAVTIHIKLIPAELEWYRSHGHKYK
jgi:hypothetical protein